MKIRGVEQDVRPMNQPSIEAIAACSFGVVFIVTTLVLAIKFPKPSLFQYTVFRIVLAVAVAGVAAFIPGLIEVSVSTVVKAGGALGVFVIVYFFSPAQIIAATTNREKHTDLVNAWEGIPAPQMNNLNLEMAHRALNALNLMAWYWNDSSAEEKRLIKAECFGPFQQWFSVLDFKDVKMSDGKSSREHLEGKLRETYEEMKAYE